MAGLRWREWGWVEMAWILHNRNIEAIALNQKHTMRKYLQFTGDFDRLRDWDNAQMADKFSDRNSS